MSRLDLIRIDTTNTSTNANHDIKTNNNDDNENGPAASTARPQRIIIQQIFDKISIGRMNLANPPHIPIGSDDSTDQVADRHAEIRKIFGQNFVVYNLSANGTYVNSKKIGKYEVLKSNDILEFGRPREPSLTSKTEPSNSLEHPKFEIKIRSSIKKKNKTTELHPHCLDKLHWLDDRMCDLLFDSSSDIIIDNIPIITLYQTLRADLEAKSSWMVIWVNVHLFIPDECGPPRRVRAFQESLGDLLEVLHENPRTPVIQYHFFKTSDLSILKINSIRTLKNIIFPLFKAYEPRSNRLDCLVYFVDFEAPFERSLNQIFDSMHRNQALLIVLLRDTRSNFKSKTECILEFFTRLGGYSNSGFIWTLGKWRVWCVDLDNDEKINLSGMPLWSPEKADPEIA